MKLKPVKFPMLLALIVAGSLSARAGEIRYVYDNAGRLVHGNYAGKTITYTYDHSGNLLQRLHHSPLDTDDDSMDDVWEQQYFGNLSRDGTGDFDNDGFSDLSEYLAGTAPNNPNSLLRITRAPEANAATTTIEWTSVPGKTYRVQFKVALADLAWTDLAGDVTASGSTAATVDPNPRDVTGFYRVLLLP